MTEDNASALAFFRYDLAPDGRNGLARVAERLRRRGARLAGVVQRDIARPDRAKCDMRLDDLATGRALSILVDRGPQARGCRLDHSAMATADVWINEALAAGADALIVNKFGKEETAGKGLFPSVGEAWACGVPALIGLSRSNREAAFRLIESEAPEFLVENDAFDWLCRRIQNRRGQ